MPHPTVPYSHAVEVPGGSRLLYISGEIGVQPDGVVPEGIEAQAEALWKNLIAILEDAGMGIGDLVKITTFLVNVEDAAAGRGSPGEILRRRPARFSNCDRQGPPPAELVD